MKHLLTLALLLLLIDGKPKFNNPYDHPRPLGTADRNVTL